MCDLLPLSPFVHVSSVGTCEDEWESEKQQRILNMLMGGNILSRRDDVSQRIIMMPNAGVD